MENSNLNNIEFNQIEKYIIYKSKLNELIEKLKQNKKYESITESLDSTDIMKNKYLMFFLFQNYRNWININFDNIYNYNNETTNNIIMAKFFAIEKLINEGDKGIKNLFCLIIQWYYFLYKELVTNIYSNSYDNFGEINKIRYLINETNYILIKLYKSKILNTSQIFEVLYFFLFLVENNYEIPTHSDKLYKIKNYLLIKGIFFILQEVSIITFEKINLNSLDDEKDNKSDIEKIVKFLEEFQNNKEINYQLNIIIILNQNILTDFIKSIIKKINIKLINKYDETFKNKLINFYFHFIKGNYKKSKIFNIFMDYLKFSFIDLYDFDNNKEKIAHDLFIQGFYLKLIKKFFFFKENSSLNNLSTPSFNSFLFNSYDSEISLNFQSDKLLEKSYLFFSFNILAKKDREIYPLFMIEKISDKKNNKDFVFSIYLKKHISNETETKNNIEEYDLYIYKDDNEIKIDKITKILTNTTYYLNITFNSNKIYINFYNGKTEVIQFEIDKNKKFFDSNFNLHFGFNKKEQISFSGYIGPIIIIKIPSSSKDIKINDLISSVLKLQNYYPYFIFLEQNSRYCFEYANHFQNNSLINKNKKKIENINFECFLYLTPDIVRFVKGKKEEINTLPDICNICPNQKDYKINNINVTLVKYEQGTINFVLDNGLYYICLLYEYIYQFMQNYLEKNNYPDEENKKDKNYKTFIRLENYNNIDEEPIFETIISIFKKTFFIIEKIYSEINIYNFNKNLKQIYMNLISCIKIVSKRICIMDYIINNFFNIIVNYCSYISDLLNIKKTNSNDSIDENKINNDLKINLSFFSGLIDFLLTPELYDFNKTQTLIRLFGQISSYFHLKGEKVSSAIINQHFYLKLLSFSPFLNKYFENYEIEENVEESDKISDKNNCEDNYKSNLNEKKEVLNCYLEAVKSFFENNSSKKENIINLKNIIKYINETIGDNYQVCLGYYNFITGLIGDNPDIYFNDEKDDDKIKVLFLYANKYSKNFIIDNYDGIDENKIKQKKNIFNKLIIIIMRIIFTKKRINHNKNIIKDFKKLLHKVDLSKELIIAITGEIKNHIIDKFLGVSKNNNNSRIDNNEKKEHIYTSEELKYTSNFYSEIFNLFLFFLEYQINNNNIKNSEVSEIYNIYEEKVFDLLEHIELMIKANIENNNKIDINGKNENSINFNDNNGLFTIDTIYCLIYFVKFYNSILLKKLYPEKYIINFINICKLCCNSCLINSNILVDLENSSKTILEIIIDICLHYIIKTSKQFFDPNPEETNNVKKESVIKEQEIIYNFLINNLFLKINNKSRENRQKYTIFYNNDYLRFLSDNYLNDNKKIQKKDSTSLEYMKEFSNYLIINNFLLNEQKFNYNFSTFFLIKLGGYNKILMELNVNINSLIPSMKVIIKYNDLFKLIVEMMQIIYEEHEKLYLLNKEFFFKSKKANSTGYIDYLEVKKRIEHCIKKKNYSQIDQYIINEIFKNDYETKLYSINSGLCKKEHKSFSNQFLQGHKKSDDLQELNPKSEKRKGLIYAGGGRAAFSSTNLVKDLQEEEEQEEEQQDIKTPKTLFKKKSKTIIFNDIQLDNSLESNNNKKKISQDGEEEDEFALYFDNETPSSESSNVNILIESEKKNNNINKKKDALSSPIPPQRIRARQKTVNASKLLSQNFDVFEKKTKNAKNERSASFFTLSSMESTFINYNENNNNIVPYINFFDEPDEYYLKNSKKELMMIIFSLYFFDSFFYNEDFIQLKKYYFQNFEGIQASTKMIDFPSKMKNFNNGLEPNLFIKPFISFFTSKIFPINHNYYYEYMKNNKILPKQIILYKKSLPEFNLEKQFDKKCELIKADHNFYGHIIGSKDYNFIVFEEQNYEFYEDMKSIINQKILYNDELDDLFTLSLVTKKPPNKHKEKVKKNLQNILKKKKNKDKKIVIILFNEIEEILERRCLLMWQALEIYLKNGKSYFFNFLTKDKYKDILEIFKNNKITKDKIHEKDYFKSQKLIKSEWIEERLSTFEYLLFLNKYGSRTFNDPNQYPIFPWLIRKYSSNPKEEDEFRNFKYPMGAQTEETQNIANNRFTDDEDNQHKFPAHFGTHYSTSAYIYFYLMREEPFTTLLVKLQGYKQENPDRMFYNFEDVLAVLDTGHDNREMIPDLYYKIEQFININCTNFGIKSGHLRIDDFIVRDNNLNKNINNKKQISKYVKFILDNRKLLDEKKISINLNEWIDNIFGVGQLPEKDRKKCLNIFYKETYEQKTDLYKKFQKLKNKNKNAINIENIISKISTKIDLIISFGQTPYQIFNRNHPKYGKKSINYEGEFEYDLMVGMWDKNIKIQIDIVPLFFIINEDIGKLFLIDKNRHLDIIDTTLFDQKGNDKYQYTKYGKLNLSHIKFFDKIHLKDDNIYYIYKHNYCISLFDEKYNIDFNQINLPKESNSKIKLFSTKETDKIDTSLGNTSNDKVDESDNNNINYNDCNDNDYISYFNLYINKLKYHNLKQEPKKIRKIIKENEYFRFITCRYIDNTFKIYNLPKNKSNLKKDYIPLSYVCEDFVTSCCTISYNKFLLGLKNGKLIQWSIEEENEDFSSKKQSIKPKIKFNKQIQAHKGAINVIEICHKIGIIITAGNDNYIFIRKIYDLELLIPIKFKSKYIITMAKVSPKNFLYIMCFNKKEGKSRIFGYTLNGLYFAKSNYDYYDTLDFTKSGNIVTWIHKKEIQILNGYNLKKIYINSNKESSQSMQNLKKLDGSNWVKFNYFFIKNEKDPNIKIITYINPDKNKVKQLLTLDVTKNKYFD